MPGSRLDFNFFWTAAGGPISPDRITWGIHAFFHNKSNPIPNATPYDSHKRDRKGSLGIELLDLRIPSDYCSPSPHRTHQQPNLISQNHIASHDTPYAPAPCHAMPCTGTGTGTVTRYRYRHPNTQHNSKLVLCTRHGHIQPAGICLLACLLAQLLAT